MNLTDNEIVNAMEDYRNSPIIFTRKGVISIGDILDLINRQKAENAELQLKNSELESDLTLKTYDYEHLLMKCKEIQAISSSRKDKLMETVINLQAAKTKAINNQRVCGKVERRICARGKGL